MAPGRQAGWPGLLGLAALVFVWRLLAIGQSGASLYVDEAQYWLWSEALDWGYFSKPPGIALLIRLSTTLFGDGLLGVKALALLCYPAAALLVWLIACRLYDAVVGGWAALIVLTLPIYAWLGLFVSTDAPLTVLWLAALWFYLEAVEAGRWRDWLALGVVCGLGLLTKYTMLLFIVAAGLHLLAFHRERLATARPWVALGVALLLLAPNLAWNLAHDWPTLRHTADITLHRQASERWAALGGFLVVQVLAFGPLFGLAVLPGIAQGWRERAAGLLLWFSIPLWLVVSSQALHGGANANWAAPAFAPLAIVLAAWLTAGRRGWLIAGLTLNVMLAALAYHAPPLLAASGVANPARYNPFVRATGWHELAEQLRPIVRAHPDAVLLADNRTVLAHMRYELRDLRPTVVSWNPRREASDHFRLTTDLGRHVGSDALYLGDQAPDAAMLGRFAGSRPLATLRAELDSNLSRRIEVHLLHAFQGY